MTTKRASNAVLLSLAIDRSSDEPVYRQIYRQVRQGVLAGALPPGARLPSTRTLSGELRCSRSTVEIAFDHLACEGYLITRVGSGTAISDKLPHDFVRPAKRVPLNRSIGTGSPGLSADCIELSKSIDWRNRTRAAFTPNFLDLSQFPFHVWSQLSRRVWRNPDPQLLLHDDPAGFWPLRQAIADYLRMACGTSCSAEQVIITSGARQAVDMISRFMLTKGERVWLEDPGFPAWRGLSLSGIETVPVPVDENGISVSQGMALAPDARMAIAAPARQFPLTVTMSLARRLELLDWAYQNDSWIVEDDFDSEFRYEGKPLATLRSLDEHSHVIFVGTFSKILFPSLRLGYMVLPERVLDGFCRVRGLIDDQPPISMQPVLAAFIKEGHLAAHFRRMRQIYEIRQREFVAAAGRHLNGLLDIDADNAGTYLVAGLAPDLAQRMSDREASDLALTRNLDCPALSNYFLAEPTRQGLLLGFSALPTEKIESSVAQLAKALATST